jgi:hypothetical protein
MWKRGVHIPTDSVCVKLQTATGEESLQFVCMAISSDSAKETETAVSSTACINHMFYGRWNHPVLYQFTLPDSHIS